jgi:predicted transcriptional regulator
LRIFQHLAFSLHEAIRERPDHAARAAGDGDPFPEGEMHGGGGDGGDSDAPSYSAVRALLATLEQKELVTHSKDSRRYVYSPTVPEKKAKRTALRQLMATFFEGSPEKLVASLLDPKDQNLSQAEIAKIRKLIDGGDEQ